MDEASSRKAGKAKAGAPPAQSMLQALTNHTVVVNPPIDVTSSGPAPSLVQETPRIELLPLDSKQTLMNEYCIGAAPSRNLASHTAPIETHSPIVAVPKHQELSNHLRSSTEGNAVPEPIVAVQEPMQALAVEPPQAAAPAEPLGSLLQQLQAAGPGAVQQLLNLLAESSPSTAGMSVPEYPDLGLPPPPTPPAPQAVVPKTMEVPPPPGPAPLVPKQAGPPLVVPKAKVL